MRAVVWCALHESCSAGAKSSERTLEKSPLQTTSPIPNPERVHCIVSAEHARVVAWDKVGV